jgi:hypothetical protein
MQTVDMKTDSMCSVISRIVLLLFLTFWFYNTRISIGQKRKATPITVFYTILRNKIETESRNIYYNTHGHGCTLNKYKTLKGALHLHYRQGR